MRSLLLLLALTWLGCGATMSEATANEMAPWEELDEASELLVWVYAHPSTRPEMERTFAARCEAGVGRDCARLGWLSIYLPVIDVAAEARGRAFFGLSCEAGYARGCLYDDFASYLYGFEDTPRDFRPLMPRFTRACSAGDAFACRELGYHYLEGRGEVPVDDRAARRFLAMACDTGDQEACSNLAVIYYAGRGVPVDLARATELSRGACERRVPIACLQLGAHHRYRDPVPTLARRYLTDACDHGAHSACTMVAMMMVRGEGGEVSDPVPRLERACAWGHGPSCGLAGAARLGIWGGDVRMDEAYAYLTTACRGEFIPGCTGQGRLLVGGELSRGTDEAAAHELFEYACAQDDDDGCYELGVDFATGRGTGTDRARAQDAYLRGCRLGDGPACNEAAVGGRSFDMPDEQRRQLYKQSCDAEYPLGCANYARMLAAGEGGPPAPDRARQLYRRACDAEVGIGCVGLAEFAIDDGDRAEASALYLRACEQGAAVGCHFTGELVRIRQGLDPRANAYFARACGAGYRPACGRVAAYDLAHAEQPEERDAARARMVEVCRDTLDRWTCAQSQSGGTPSPSATTP